MMRRLLAHPIWHHHLPRWMRNASEHVGRRGAFLALFGLVYVLIGYSYLGDRPTVAVRVALRLATNVMPLWGYGIVWIACGTIAIVFGLIFSPAWDAVGFVAAVTMPALWSFVYFTSWVNGDSIRGWLTSILFLAIAGAVAVVSGMPNPVDVDRVARSHEVSR